MAGEGQLIQVKEEEACIEAWPVVVKEEENSDAAALVPVKGEEQKVGEVMQVLVKMEESDEEYQFPYSTVKEAKGRTDL